MIFTINQLIIVSFFSLTDELVLNVSKLILVSLDVVERIRTPAELVVRNGLLWDVENDPKNFGLFLEVFCCL
jgi:hypothetical protein